MGHSKCCVCSGRIPSNVKKIRRTSEPQVNAYMQELGFTLPLGEPICDCCRQDFRRKIAKFREGESGSTADDPSVNINENEENAADHVSHDDRGDREEGNLSGFKKEHGNGRQGKPCRAVNKANASRIRMKQVNSNVETQYSEATDDSSLQLDSANRVQLEKRRKPLPFSKNVPKVVLDDVLSVGKSDAECFLCGTKHGKDEPVRTRVPKEAILDLWVQRRVLIPKGNRCCSDHLESKKFSEQAKTQILLLARKGATVAGDQFKEWINNLADLVQCKEALIDFDSEKLTDQDYKLFTGLNKAQFNSLLSFVEKSLYFSKHRSPRQSLAVFMTQIRLGISQALLSSLFGMPIQRISDTIATVTDLLNENFVPNYLGFDHMSREKARSEHINSYVSSLFKMSPEKLMLIIDATYIYINKPQNHEDQRVTYSMVKHRNLVKPTMFVLPDGYIYETIGLNKSDTNNNDAEILLANVKEKNGFKSVMKRDDHLVVDRGYRDARLTLVKKPHYFKVHMPDLLKKGQEQFTTQEANKTRIVTMTRWVVEAVNGRLKNVFKFFAHQIHNSYMKGNKLCKMWRIACAISNAIFPPLYTQSAKHQTILEEVEKRMKKSNGLKTRVVKGEWKRKKSVEFVKATADNIADFPLIQEADLFSVTLGSYQAKNAIHYARRHLEGDPEYSIMVHHEEDHLIRAQIRSRFHSKDNHFVWIKYDPTKNGIDAISQYYCSCKVGARTVGTCSHVTAIIWYLGYFRHTGKHIRNTGFADILLDAARRRVASEKVPPKVAVASTTSPCPVSTAEGLEDIRQSDFPSASATDDGELNSVSSPSNAVRKLVISEDLAQTFLSCVEDATMQNVESCALLTGREISNLLYVTDLIIPKQSGTSCTCNMEAEEEILALQSQLGLVTLGWIHTHPSQTAFLSAIDLHTQYAYQRMMAEAVAIVCAPSYGQNLVFNLTHVGLAEIMGCNLAGFHPHSDGLFQEALHVVLCPKSKLQVHDLRSP